MKGEVEYQRNRGATPYTGALAHQIARGHDMLVFNRKCSCSIGWVSEVLTFLYVMPYNHFCARALLLPGDDIRNDIYMLCSALSRNLSHL